MSIYEGIRHIRAIPRRCTDPTWNYAVLGAAFVFEGSSFGIARRQFRGGRGSTPFWKALRLSKDPTTDTVLAEDSAALIGLLIAAAGIALSHRYAMPELAAPPRC
ncbi:MAG: hypothetical protein ABIX46_13805 [Burkholderiaceae bacterium]